MAIIKGDPTHITDQDKYFMNVAKVIAEGSTHPIAPGGCVLVRQRNILGDGRSILASCKVEVDCVAYAIGTAASRGTPLQGAVVYTTRYPFSAAIFQLHLMGIRKVIVLAHEWEPYYKDEFRRAARLARELQISIEPHWEDEDQRFSTNNQSPRFDNQEEHFQNKDLYTSSPVEEESFDIEKHTEYSDEFNTSV